ncbi:transposase [Streptomyces sp. 3N207]|uniref:transposase n=1 Tax=Streptomyces sp. 3N207 TaxID=3457417 RepID=UPI003FD57028
MLPTAVAARHRWQRADCTQFEAVLEKIRAPVAGRAGRPRTKPDSLAADKAYSNGPCRQYLRRRGIRHIIQEKTDSQPLADARAHAADGHPASTKSGTRSATPSSGRSTGSSRPGPWPLATTNAATSSAPPPSQPS